MLSVSTVDFDHVYRAMKGAWVYNVGHRKQLDAGFKISDSRSDNTVEVIIEDFSNDAISLKIGDEQCVCPLPSVINISDSNSDRKIVLQVQKASPGSVVFGKQAKVAILVGADKRYDISLLPFKGSSQRTYKFLSQEEKDKLHNKEHHRSRDRSKGWSVAKETRRKNRRRKRGI